MNQEHGKNRGGFIVDGAFLLLTLPLRYLFGAKITLLLAKIKLIVVLICLVAIVIVAALLIYNNNQLEEEQTRRSQGSNYTRNTTLSSELVGKVLDVPYFNQWLEPDGSKYPQDGWKMCGAASATMIAAYYRKITYTSQSDLKRFMYEDKGLNLPRYCNQYGGTFGVTSKNAGCNYSTGEGMSKYFSAIGLQTRRISPTFDAIKSEIDQGRPIIFSTIAPYDHIAVIKGYTNDGRLIMNDPFKNTQDGAINYNYSTSGRDAVYSLSYPGLNMNYLLSVSN